jgi:DNA end-binding protein Ku
MRMKAIWKGSISFGLVDIPVNLYSAIEQHSFGFTMLHAKCHTPLTYHRWCDHCHEEVPWASVVKGILLKNGSYLILTKEKLAEMKAVQTDQIKVIEFVDADLIPPLYVDNNYYLSPTQKNSEAYFLFAKALEKTNKVAIGRFVFKEREHMVTLKAYSGGLLLTTLNYDYEIREQQLPKAPVLDKKELALAEQLIAKLTVKKFDISTYKDSFIEQLKAHIKQAEKSKKKTASKVTRTKKTISRKKSTLLTHLQESLRSTPIARA